MVNKIKVVMFGAGLVGREILPKLGAHVQALAFSDNDPNKHGTEIFNVPVVKPGEITELDYDFVLITSTSISDIYDQLIGLGIEKNKIIIMDDAQASSPEFPWDAIIFLVLVFICLAGIIVFLLQ